MFTVSGRIAGLDGVRFVTWDNGTLTGDPTAVEWVESSFALYEGRPIGPPGGPYERTNLRKKPLAALIVVVGSFDVGTTVLAGDIPERPSIPADAIG